MTAQIAEFVPCGAFFKHDKLGAFFLMGVSASRWLAEGRRG